MTTNYWPHQDITRKNFQRAVTGAEMVRGLELPSVNPISRLVMVLFYQQVLSPLRFIGYFPVQIIYLPLVLLVPLRLLNGFQTGDWWVVASLLPSPPLLS